VTSGSVATHFRRKKEIALTPTVDVLVYLFLISIILNITGHSTHKGNLQFVTSNQYVMVEQSIST
jgi:biopolymer transport protein ExbD